MGNSRKCAYCGTTKGLTREHLFPRFLYKKSGPEQIITIARTATGDKAVASQLQIADVCSGCNGGVLSALDEYAKELHDKYFETIVHPGDRIGFVFDYDRLLRWLLKIGYNFARARGWTVSPRSDLPAYILGRILHAKGFRLFVQLIVPTRTDSLQWEQRPGADEIPPASARVELLDVGLLPGFSIAFKVSLNSYSFHVLREKPGSSVPSQVRNRVLKDFIKRTPGAYEMTGRNRASLYASSLDFMSTIAGDRLFQEHLDMMKKHEIELGSPAKSKKKV